MLLCCCVCSRRLKHKPWRRPRWPPAGGAARHIRVCGNADKEAVGRISLSQRKTTTILKSAAAVMMVVLAEAEDHQSEQQQQQPAVVATGWPSNAHLINKRFYSQVTWQNIFGCVCFWCQRFFFVCFFVCGGLLLFVVVLIFFSSSLRICRPFEHRIKKIIII